VLRQDRGVPTVVQAGDLSTVIFAAFGPAARLGLAGQEGSCPLQRRPSTYDSQP
jgi:hypothetical protein